MKLLRFVLLSVLIFVSECAVVSYPLLPIPILFSRNELLTNTLKDVKKDSANIFCKLDGRPYGQYMDTTAGKPFSVKL